MRNLELATTIISNHSDALALAHHLMKQSVWYSVEPLPDDRYEFHVKAEHEFMFRTIGVFTP